MSGKYKVLDTTSDTRRVLWIFGLYHGIQLPKYALFEARRVATIGMAVAFPCLILAKMLLSKTDPAMFAKQISFLILSFWVILRLLLHIDILPKQRALESLLRNDIFNLQNERQDCLISAVKKQQKYFVRAAIVFTVIIVFGFILPPIVTNTNTNVPIWTLFHGKTEDVFISIYESCTFLIVGTAYLLIDCNFIGFTSIVTVQIKILKDNLEHATERDSRADYNKNERKIQERLRTCIIHHNAILNLAERVTDLFATILFLQIIFSVLEICFFGVQLTTETDRTQLIFWLICFVGVVGHIMVSCWCGQTLITESSGIIEACYMSEWYNCTPSTRKMYFIIMEQAKRPITVNGGPFFLLSFDIFVNILRSAYSYYTVFSQVYNK